MYTDNFKMIALTDSRSVDGLLANVAHDLYNAENDPDNIDAHLKNAKNDLDIVRIKLGSGDQR